MTKFVLLGLLIAGGVIDGSWKGAVAWGLILFMGWFLWEVAHYDPYNQHFSPPKESNNYTEEVQVPAIRGKRNPDPTRPTTDDFAGMLTNYIERKRG
jgi:hypothetical protein